MQRYYIVPRNLEINKSGTKGSFTFQHKEISLMKIDMGWINVH